MFIQEVLGLYTSPFLDTDDLKMAFRARKVSGAFEKRAPGLELGLHAQSVIDRTNYEHRSSQGLYCWEIILVIPFNESIWSYFIYMIRWHFISFY